MIIDIPDHEKPYVGRVIDFARKQQKRSIEEITQGICARQTYQKIIKSIVTESEIYDSLLSRLGLHYDYETSITPSYVLLWEAFLDQNWNAFYHEIKVIKCALKNWDIYRYILHCFIECIEQKLSLDSAKQLLPLLPKSLQEIASYFILTFLYKEEIQDKQIFTILSMETAINQCEYLFLLIKQEQYYHAAILCNELLHTTYGKLHYSVLIAKLFIIQAIQIDDFDQCCTEIKNDPCFIPHSDSTNQFSYTAGMFYYAHQDYEKAWEYLSQVYTIEKYTFPSVLFLYHMETITNYQLPKHDTTHMINENTEKAYRVFFQYYNMKYNHVPFSALENYLWNECRAMIPFVYPQNIAKTIIHDELFWISNQTGDKKKYYQFNKKK